jgi:AraC-like DNA-binding protein
MLNPLDKPYQDLYHLNFETIYKKKYFKLNLSDDFPILNNLNSLVETYVLESGILLNLTDISPVCPCKLECTNLEETVGFGFCLAGMLTFDIKNHKSPINLKPGTMVAFSTPFYDKYIENLANYEDKISRISVSIRKSVFYELDNIYDGILKNSNIFSNLNIFVNVYSIPNSCRLIISELFNCNLIGPLRRLYMEAKGLELFVDCLRYFSTDQCYLANEAKSPTRRQIEQAEMAAELLTKDFEVVPTLSKLAQEVGLSRCRLTEVFRKVHGTTPFAYLRSKRLEWAKELLIRGEVNVTEAALATGYSSLSHFTKAFTDHFNLHPSELRRLNRSQIIVHLS